VILADISHFQGYLTVFDQIWFIGTFMIQAIMANGNLVMVTYFLWSSDIGLYLQDCLIILVKRCSVVYNDTDRHVLQLSGHSDLLFM